MRDEEIATLLEKTSRTFALAIPHNPRNHSPAAISKN